MGPIGKALGMGKKPMLGAEEEDGEYSSPSLDETEEVEAPADDVPPEFASLYQEYSDAPSAKGLYDLIEACKGSDEAEKPGGLALILGGKGKKP